MNTRLYKFFLLLVILFSCNKTSPEETLDGILEVPENRNDSNSRTLELAYKVLKARRSSSLKTPIVYLQGGPGGTTLIMEEFWANHPLRNDRDIVLMDQRGTGTSEANCTEIGSSLFDIMRQDFDVEEDFKATSLLMNECKNIIRRERVDLAGYNSREIAADFEDLRKTLGFRKWNLYGTSYGSRLGLTIMRDFPKSVRSAIFLGISPLESNPFSGDRVKSIDRSLHEVFRSCKKNKECNNRYPNLKERLQKILSKMQIEPLSFDYKGRLFVLNTHDVFLLLCASLYDRDTIRNTPFFIEALENEETKTINEFLQLIEPFYNSINFPMNYSVNAYEELPFYDEKNLDIAIKQSDFGFAFTFFYSAVKLLADWHPYRATNIENKPVISEIPTLIVSGSLDPVTPSSNSISTLEYLKNGYVAIFLGESHNFLNPCLLKMTEEFIDDPLQKPNIDCSSERKSVEWNLLESSR